MLTYLIERENTFTIPEIAAINLLFGEQKVIDLSVIRDTQNQIVKPEITGIRGTIITALSSGKLYLTTGILVEFSTYEITFTYTSSQFIKTEDINGDGVVDNIIYRPVTKTKKVSVTVQRN